MESTFWIRGKMKTKMTSLMTGLTLQFPQWWSWTSAVCGSKTPQRSNSTSNKYKFLKVVGVVPDMHAPTGCLVFQSVHYWLKNAERQLGIGCGVECLLTELRDQGSISSGTMVRMTSSLPRLTTVRSVSSLFMAVLTSLAEVIRSPLMLMMTSLSRRPALLQRKTS